MIHELKTWVPYYRAIVEGKKKFEVRLNDRNFQVGDKLKLREYDNTTGEYTGRAITVDVSYILNGGSFGIEKDYVVMSFGATIKYHNH